MEAVARPGEPAGDAVDDPAASGALARAGERALVFAGFMGAGKSTAARVAAAELETEALDSDRELELELGESLESFFDREGEAAFREREERTVLSLLTRDDARVVALGGGALRSDAVREAVRRHLVVHLEVDPDDAWHRASGKGRPLARDRVRFDELHQARRSLYDSVADAFLPPGERDVVHRSLPALVRLRDTRDPAGLKLAWAHAASGDYPVYLARGLLTSGFLEPRERRRFLVTDQNVERLHGRAADALAPFGRAVFPPGEGEKTLARAEAVLREMARAAVERDDAVVALGGGVVGDLAGFCAAVYQRGVACVQAPTTLVAQVDSAYGGKTGVDLPEGKNYAGAYHQPVAVLVDPAVLGTLPAEERAAGYAEVVKTALIAGGDLWSRVRKGGDPDEGVILGCLRTKLGVVREDERDAGRRQVLNLGHTVAHALEAATGFRGLRHGEAVGLGLLCALRLSERESVRSEVAELLSGHGLPLRADGVDGTKVLELVERDKKRRGGRVPFVLVDSPGRVSPGHDVSEQALRTALAEVIAGR
jgi:shikimate kinase/3-dehydroquinate synthase